MRVLVTGASGFIGAAVVAALAARGHRVVACVHRAPASAPDDVERIAVDYRRDTDAAAWLPRLRGVDAVVNAVGILREARGATFLALHSDAPRALFAACEAAGVGRVVQISALGADAQARSRYHLSKKAADDALRAGGLDWTVIQPSVVFGAGGASTGLFLRLAALPLTPLVGGDSRMQPVHIDDLSALVVRALETGCASRETVAAVGPRAVTLREMLSVYRRALGLGRAWLLPVPMPLVRLAAVAGDLTHAGSLSTETLGMLQRGNTGSDAALRRCLGRAPRAPEAFIPSAMAPALRLAAVWGWLYPLLLATIAAVWISGGVVSWLYGREYGLALLADLGLPPGAAAFAFAASCALNVVLGVLTLLWPRRPLWLAQLAVMVFYTAALSVVAPELWADPFGALVKNLPLAALLLGLLYLTPGR